MIRQELDRLYARAGTGGKNRAAENALCEHLIAALRLIELYEGAPESMHLETDMLRGTLEGLLPSSEEATAPCIAGGDIWTQAFKRGFAMIMEEQRGRSEPPAKGKTT